MVDSNLGRSKRHAYYTSSRNPIFTLPISVQTTTGYSYLNGSHTLNHIPAGGGDGRIPVKSNGPLVRVDDGCRVEPRKVRCQHVKVVPKEA